MNGMGLYEEGGIITLCKYVLYVRELDSSKK